MLFRRGGSAPWALAGTGNAPPSPGSVSTAIGRRRKPWSSLRQTGSEIATGIAFALLLIAWDKSGFLVPPDPWDNLVMGVITAVLGCLMLVFLHRQQRAVAKLRRNETQLAEQTAL